MSHLEPKTSPVQTQKKKKKNEGFNDCGLVLLFAAAVLVGALAMKLVC